MQIVKVVLENKKTILAEISDNNIAILNSYKITSIKDMKSALNTLKLKAPDHPTLKRSMMSLVCEWRAHNLLYKLGIKKSHTITVDLESNQNKYMTAGYFLLSLLYI